MKQLLKILLLILVCPVTRAQQTVPDSLRQALSMATSDSARFDVSRILYTYYEETNRDSAFYYSNERLALVRKNNRKIEEAYVLGQMSYQLTYLGKFGESLKCLLQAYEIANNPAIRDDNTWTLSAYPSPGKTRLFTLSMIHHMFGHLMQQTQNKTQQLYHFKEGRNIALSVNNKFRIMVADMMLASSYISMNDPDSAWIFATEGEKAVLEGGIKKYYGALWAQKGDVYLKRGDDKLASEYYHKALQSAIEGNNMTTVAAVLLRLVNYSAEKGNKDSVLFYAIRNLETVRSLGAVITGADRNNNIGAAYEQVYIGYKLAGRTDSAYKYLQLSLTTKDSLHKIQLRNLADFQSLSLDEQLRLQNLEKEKIAYSNRIRTWAMLAGIGVFMIVAFLFFINSLNRRRANAILKKQKEELQSALLELKSTQDQLIQSEKMASLGELTAGIAHEIQNPLNFVNNFSEVNKELLGEMKEEIVKGNLDEVSALADDIMGNEEKINHHGKRADAIVKGMLQHSRSSSGVKEPTDINKLADEYFRLAYHGLRAKDKSFNATLKTDYDESLPMVNVIPQDLGRVVLNLITNAFYAVTEKAAITKASEDLPAGDSAMEGKYEPTVTLTTKKTSKGIEIRVADNGSGIPVKILDKIFQPFFTTKPTGQGTGLGLSMSYDIITKGHGGELKAETTENKGTIFIIVLPS